jgi:hypothetical protein
MVWALPPSTDILLACGPLPNRQAVPPAAAMVDLFCAVLRRWGGVHPRHPKIRRCGGDKSRPTPIELL